MRKGNLNVISAKSAASSWKLIDLAPPPASAASKTRARAGTIGLVSTPRGMKSRLTNEKKSMVRSMASQQRKQQNEQKKNSSESSKAAAKAA